MGKKLTTEEFIKKAQIVHGDTYDYSLVDYKDIKTKIKIICPKHGIFLQTPTTHLMKKGCPKCVGKNKTIEEFIEQAKTIHGDKYDYSLVDYKNNSTNVKIICREHGEFEQKPKKHLQGSGCPKCANNIQLTTEEFIEKAKAIHGEKYDYSLVDYKNAKTKIKIICPEHGEFEQRPNSHLNGQGCPKCAGGISVGEKTICDILDSLGEKYIYNKSLKEVFKTLRLEDKYEDFMTMFLKELKGKNTGFGRRRIERSRFDFTIIREGNVYSFIEYDGKQHFKFISYFFKTLQGFLFRHDADELKTMFSETSGIPLLRIRYDQLNDAEYMIKDMLNNPIKYTKQHNTYLSEEEYWSVFEEEKELLIATI